MHRASRRAAVRAVVLACCLLAAGCSSPGTGGTGGTGTSTPPAPSTQAESPVAVPPSASPAPPAHRVSKILVIMEENHSLEDVFPSGMPYLWQLARRYGQAAAWSDIGHPSLPNYLAIFAGSAFGGPQDCYPGPGCSYPGPSVFGQAIAKGKTARAYEESMPTPCDPINSGNYDVNHNPWPYIPGEARLCHSDDVPAGTPARGALVSDVRHGTLPTVGMVTPNLNDDAHNGTLANADAWLRSWMPVLMSGPDWRVGRLAIVVLFDEGESTDLVPFVIVAPGVSGVVARRQADHYALTRLIDEVAGTAPLRQAAGAPNLAPVFGLGP
jgi:hypothetical protein